MKASRDGGKLQSAKHRRSPTFFRATFDREQTPPSMAVVAALSNVMDVDPVDMDPLQGIVDTDALDAILGDRSGDSKRAVTLTVADYSVTVGSDGTVSVASVDAERTEPADTVTFPT